MSHPLNTPLGRFGVVTSQDEPHECVASIPVGGMVNPLTGAPTIAPLALLVDHACGLVNHRRRGAGEWTVSSELSLEADPDTAEIVAAAADVPVVATARPFGNKGDVSLATCELAHRGNLLATATVRSFYIRTPGDVPPFPDGPTGPPPPGTLGERMAVRIAESAGAGPVLLQDEDPVLNNLIGIVHGGVSAMALELVASAALNADRTEAPLRTSSLHVNFMRPFHGGIESRYAGTTLRVGRSTGVAEAKAVGPGGEVAIVARLTAYR
ncbi:PaaI family thioesterase [Mycobacterium sp. E740]|uniref:PaaI family thioesterase n=1 Tax=Mycobacterium sp. E740 TaxID=1834149 RepID=UPI0007FC2E5D|nr:PaaI family thioesterase [Mycobacterium sp. E740]OBI84601.1 phenylacetic acid degradation protein [Mycobacterium sp. E740]